MLKYIKIIFFIFLKIIFKISALKRFNTHKKLNFNKKNFKNDFHRVLKCYITQADPISSTLTTGKKKRVLSMLVEMRKN